jgi:histidine triad (HIT) family protein
MTSCVFCAIVAGSAPAHRVLEESECIAFLDARPLFPGHVLLVPREHIETMGDMSPGLVGPFFGAARRLAVAMEQGLKAQGSFVAVTNRVSQSVPHLHAHVVPRHKGDGLRGFFWPRQKYATDAEAAEIAGRLREALR